MEQSESGAGEGQSEAEQSASVSRPQFDPETGAPICGPLKTLEEVWAWQPGEDDFCVATKPLAPRTHRPGTCPRTLVCHDMMGGYLDDRFVQGYHGDQCYRFYSWQYLDTFVYFSHYFITIPPPWWTNMCHKHGVKILGTFITEWDEGNLRCQEFLESEENYQALVAKMVTMATYYNFDGWLVNIENKIEPEKVINLLGFVQYLTKEMHAARPDSTVIWYDSVTTSGDLKWQDALNDLNKPYFNYSDGIFLNYGWKDKDLSDSAALCCRCKRPLDVYVGVDVWGRGCFGGGGFNTDKAVAKAREHNLSVAIFAQGWVYETLDKKDFTENEDKFWGCLDELCPPHGSSSLPFYSHFCQGWGHRYHQDGQVLSGRPWINLGLQSLQPTFTDTQFREQRAGGQHKQSLHWHLDDAFCGGSSVRLQATAPSAGERIYMLGDFVLCIL